MSRPRITVIALVALVLSVLPSPAAGQQPDSSAADRAVEVRVIEHDEFRWGDAAIGALAGVGLTALCAGVIVATERKKRSIS